MRLQIEDVVLLQRTLERSAALLTVQTRAENRWLAFLDSWECSEGLPIGASSLSPRVHFRPHCSH